MTAWPARLLVNTAYAYLVAQADALDRAEVALYAHADEKQQANLCRNRDELDANLLAPSGRMAVAEKALLREIGGAA